MILLFKSRPETLLLLLLFGDIDDDVSEDGDFPPDTLDRMDCESSDTVIGLWMEATVCMLVTKPVEVVCSWFITSNDSFVSSETRRFFSGELFEVVGLRLLLSLGVFFALLETTLLRER